MYVHTSHQPYGYHLLRYVHGNERTKMHDVIYYTFAAITQNVGFHVEKKLHALISTTFNSFHQHVNIVLNKDDICTLVDVVIVDPKQLHLLPQSCAIQGFTTSYVTQTKERSYCNRHPTDQFLPLTIEIFGYLHKYANVFLQDCANDIWSLKGLKGPHVYTLVTFLCQKVLITLQRMQTSSILSQTIAIGLTTSQLPPLQDTPPITMANLF